MKKLIGKRLSLNRETLYALSSAQSRAAFGAGPTAASQCRQATDCGCGQTNDPDLCAVTWVSTCPISTTPACQVSGGPAC